MDLKGAFKSFLEGDGDRAVSPVIGVILMVAITVILAAVIGTFVLGLGDRVSQASPSATFTFDYTTANDGTVEIAHDGGEAVKGDQVKVTVGGKAVWDAGTDENSGTLPVSSSWGTGDITAGDSITFHDNGGATNDIQDGMTVKVIWTASGSDKTAVIGESEVNL
ncbi:type IV pilin [Halorussus sp. AFM4]|uniref:type IV pilin n=1 Tax=Halorussus sp. AFM4 TaxID=3421651 RepID=UPI003EB9F9F5